MQFTRVRRRSLLSAKSFTIAMVLVNATCFALVQQKMKGAQVDDAYALDDGVRPLAVARAALPERPIVPAIEFAQAESQPIAELPAIKPLPRLALDLDMPEPAVPSAAAPTHTAHRGLVERPAPLSLRGFEDPAEVRLTRIDRMPTPVAAKAGKPKPEAKRPVLIESLPSPGKAALAPPQGAKDSFTAAFGAGGPQAEADPVVTVGPAQAPTLSAEGSLGLEPAGSALQAPVLDRPAEPAGATTITLPVPAELPPSETAAPEPDTAAEPAAA